MQPCGLCGDLYIDAAGYCPTCRAFRGSPGSAAQTTMLADERTGTVEYWAELRSRYRTANVMASLRRVRWRGPMALPLIVIAFGLVMVAAVSAVGLPSLARTAGTADGVPAVLPPPPGPAPSPSQSPETDGSASPDALPASSDPALAVASAAPSGPPQAPAAAPSATPSGEPTRKRIDPCVVGSWKAATEERHLAVSAGLLRFTGKGTAVKFRADGTGVFDVGAGSPLTATAGSTAWAVIYTGSIPFTSFETRGGELAYGGQAPKGTTAQKVNGAVVKTGALTPWSGSFRYSCSGGSLRLAVGNRGTAGYHVLDLRRA